MKKIILAVLALFFVVFGNENNSIVGTWETIWVNDRDENRRVEVIVKLNNTGTETQYRNGKITAVDEFTWKWENGFVYVYYLSHDVGPNGETPDPRTFAYNGGDTFNTDGLTFTRKENSTSITTRQRAQAQSNFQISRNSNSLHLNFADNSLKRIEIVNLQGRILNSQSFSAKTQSVDISNLPRGVFVLRVFEGSGVGVVRFVRE